LLTCLLLVPGGLVQAQNNASTLSAISLLPMASVVLASQAAAGVADVSATVLVAGAQLSVRAVESTARGTVYVLERASDGVRISVEVTARAAGAASLAVGTAVTVITLSAGVILSVAGEAIAFIPNAVGRALMHNQRLTN
jgi:hypothetical protein